MKEQKNNLVIPASIILAGFLVAVGIYLSNKGNAPVAVNTNTVQNSTIVINPVSKTDHILGNPNAPIVIVEFSDTECPYCKMFQTTMQTIMNTYGKDGKVAWVYRHFPVHTLAPKEAEATECANELGGNDIFWKYIDNIFSVTDSRNDLDPAELSVIAKNNGLDVTKFNTCLSSGKYSNLVQADQQDGRNAGVSGTPNSILILKNALSDDAKNKVDAYVVKNQIYDNRGSPIVYVSSDKKYVVVGGNLPVGMMNDIIDMILK